MKLKQMYFLCLNCNSANISTGFLSKHVHYIYCIVYSLFITVCMKTYYFNVNFMYNKIFVSSSPLHSPAMKFSVFVPGLCICILFCTDICLNVAVVQRW